MLSNQISILGLNIKIYPIMFALGIFYVIEFGKSQFSKKYPQWKPETLENIIIIMILTGLVTARLWYVTSQLPYYSKNIVEIFQPWKGGIAIQGGIIGAILGAIIGIKKYNMKLSILQLLEEVTIFIFIGHAIGRWGNFYNQEVYGFAISQSLTTTLIYTLVTLQAVLIIGMIVKSNPIEQIKSKKHISSKNWIKLIGLIFYSVILVRLFTGYGKLMVQYLFIDKAYRLPLFLIEGNLNIIAFIIIWLLTKNRFNFSRAGAYFISYGVIRSSLELLRNENDIMRIANIPVSFILSIIFIIVGIIIIIKKPKEAK